MINITLITVTAFKYLNVLSEAIPEAVETTCGKCTPKQKHLIRKVIKAVMSKHPDAWEQLVQKYDKNNKYRETFNDFIEEND